MLDGSIARRHYAGATAALLTGSCVLALSGLLLLQQVRGEVEQLGGRAVGKVTEILADADSVYATLTSRRFAPCSSEHLLAMRGALFRAHHLRDVGYFENEALLCTTALGRLEVPLAMVEEDFRGRRGGRYWINGPLLLLDGDEIGVAVALAPYTAVFDLRDLRELFVDLKWSLSHTREGVVHAVAGPGTPVAAGSPADGVLDVGFLGCSGSYPLFCISVMPTPGDWVPQHKLAISLGIAASIAFAAIAYRLALTFSAWQSSTRHRVARGLRRGSFYWEFQPIVLLDSGTVVGCEALARFRDRRGILSPAEFMPALRELKQTWLFTVRMFDTVLLALSSRHDLPDDFRVGLNIFPRDALDSEIVSLAQRAAFRDRRVRVVLEVTEDEALDESAAVHNLRQLKREGFILAIDDFGVGYSNLAQLERVECDILKIDRSFIVEMEDRSVRSSIIPHIVEIARPLGIDVVAEGIENARQREALISAGVTHGQGWLFGRPGTIDDLLAAIAQAGAGKSEKFA